MPSAHPKLGFIGLGVMGSRMARNLANKMPESPLFTYDLSDKVTQELKANTPNTTICQSSKEVAEKSVCGDEEQS